MLILTGILSVGSALSTSSSLLTSGEMNQTSSVQSMPTMKTTQQQKNPISTMLIWMTCCQIWMMTFPRRTQRGRILISMISSAMTKQKLNLQQKRPS